MIRFSCSCGKPFEVKDEYVGRKIRCRFCSEISVIPPPSDARVSGHLEMLDWRTLGDMPVPDKVCLHCGELVDVGAKMCTSCGEVFGWADTDRTPEVTMEVSDEAIDSEPEAPELTQSGRFKNIEDVEDAPAQFEMVEITAKPQPVQLELLKLPHAEEPRELDVVEGQSRNADGNAKPPSERTDKPAAEKGAEKTAGAAGSAGTFDLDGIIEEEEKPKKTVSGRIRKSRKRKLSGRRRTASRRSGRRGKPKR